MSFWADEKTGRLDELCCLLFPHRAKAEFLSLAPTLRHLGQFPQELKDEGTVGTRWRRRFTKWMREKKAQKVDWEARVEEKSEGKRARAWVKNPGGRKGERAYQALLRLCSGSWGHRWRASHDSVREVRPQIPDIAPRTESLLRCSFY